MRKWIKKDIEKFKKEREKIVKAAHEDAEKFKKDWQSELPKEEEE